MGKLLRIYNQNRALVFAIIGTIALIFIILQVLNSFVREEKQAKINNIMINNSSTSSNSTTISRENKSAVTGEEVKNSKTDKEIIKEFVEYCNNGEIQKAYDMLTEDCKEKVYPSISDFKNSYYERIFSTKRMYNLENWFTNSMFNTYSIEYIEDILATGNKNSKNSYDDYITVTRINNESKLNINSYVGSMELNRSKTVSGLTVTVNKMHMYMDYTILDITLKNESQNTICIDTKEKVQTMYLYDESGVKYTALLNENAKDELEIEKYRISKINIKFNKMYNTESRDIYGIKLEDVVLNYEKYLSGKEEKDKITIDVGI